MCLQYELGGGRRRNYYGLNWFRFWQSGRLNAFLPEQLLLLGVVEGARFEAIGFNACLTALL